MTTYYRETSQGHGSQWDRRPSPQQLEAAVRTRIGFLIRSGAHPCRTGPKDKELGLQLRVLGLLDPAFTARARALAGLPAANPKRTKGH